MEWANSLKTFEVTQFGAINICQFVGRQMADQGDPPAGAGNYKILLISSVMAEHSHLLPSSTAYCMAKASLDSMTKSLASGLAQHQINVNCIHPGWIDTPAEREVASDAEISVMARNLPFGIGKPDDVAKVQSPPTAPARHRWRRSG